MLAQVVARLFIPQSAANPSVRLSAALRSMRCTRSTMWAHTHKIMCLKYSEWVHYSLLKAIMLTSVKGGRLELFYIFPINNQSDLTDDLNFIKQRSNKDKL